MEPVRGLLYGPTAHGECSWHVHWSMASGPWSSCQHRPAIFSLDVCFQESCHTGPCVYDGDRLLNKRTRVAVTALMVFTHVYSVYTLPNTCRPTRALYRPTCELNLRIASHCRRPTRWSTIITDLSLLWRLLVGVGWKATQFVLSWLLYLWEWV